MTDDFPTKIRTLMQAGHGSVYIGRQLGISKDAALRLMRKAKAEDLSSTSCITTLPLDRIIVGERIREKFDNIPQLAQSISDRGGLINPITVGPALPDGTHELIAGDRRMRAWQHENCRFKGEPIPVTIFNPDDKTRAEFDENEQRDALKPSEYLKAMRIFERAKDAWEANTKAKRSTESKPAPGRPADPEAPRAGRFKDQIAAYVGRDRKTVEKAVEVAMAAEENPERFGKLLSDMDRTENVNGPYRRLKIMQQTDALKAQPPSLPGQGPYSVMVIDYPWPHEPDMSQEEIDAAGRSLRPYPPMALDIGRSFMLDHVGPLVADDAIVFFWTTNFHMPHAFSLLAPLGFPVHSTIGTWVKQRQGRGQVLRDKTEHCIVAKRGKPLINLTHQTTAWEGWSQPRENSMKPPEFYRMVETLCPAKRYSDIFSFGPRGALWDCYGDQAQLLAVQEEAAE
jgi:N6-adenosine-specific RNA methylase IME4